MQCCSANLQKSEEMLARAVCLVILIHTEDLFPIIFTYQTEICQLIKCVKFNGNLPFLFRLKNCDGILNADPLHQIFVLHRCIIYFDRTQVVSSQPLDKPHRLGINVVVIL